jgi:dTDP-4-dehydrorhamnose 3,5-epimerase-like enzyme
VTETLDAVRAALVRDARAPDAIAGVGLRALTIHRDPRGTLTELLRADWSDAFGEDLPFAQVYASVTGAGVARDEDRWHVHQHQVDRFLCLAGRIVVAIADPRPGSPTAGGLMLVELAAEPDAPAPLLVTIPAETLHGFVVTSEVPALLLNFPTRLYDPADEGRVPFHDAAVCFRDGAPFSFEAVRALYRR